MDYHYYLEENNMAKTTQKKMILYTAMIIVALNSSIEPLRNLLPDSELVKNIIIVSSFIILWGIVWIQNNEV